MPFNVHSPVWAVLMTQFMAFAVWNIELHHKVQMHETWIARRSDIAEKVARVEERIRLAEIEINELEEQLGRFQHSH